MAFPGLPHWRFCLHKGSGKFHCRFAPRAGGKKGKEPAGAAQPAAAVAPAAPLPAPHMERLSAGNAARAETAQLATVQPPVPNAAGLSTAAGRQLAALPAQAPDEALAAVPTASNSAPAGVLTIR